MDDFDIEDYISPPNKNHIWTPDNRKFCLTTMKEFNKKGGVSVCDQCGERLQ